jgi:hypothetical protein
MSFSAISSEPWQPLADDQLSWFRAEQKLFLQPRPLEYSVEVYAVVFGLTYALESVEFPLHAVRSRLIHGRVYLAAVPSAMAEANLSQRLANIHDQSLRYTRNVQRAWEQQIKPEVERYNRWFDELRNFTGTSAELAELMRQLRRARANQWFAVIRGVLVPRLLLEQNDAQLNAETAASAGKVSMEAMALTGRRGGELITAALIKAGERLAQANAIAKAEDVFWLEWTELRDLLRCSENRRELIGQRQRAAASDSNVAAVDSLGPPLAADAPRMYLLREVLQLLDE